YRHTDRLPAFLDHLRRTRAAHRDGTQHGLMDLTEVLKAATLLVDRRVRRGAKHQITKHPPARVGVGCVFLGHCDLSLGGATMRNRNILEEGSVEAIASLRKQDDEFCRRLRIAIEMGNEFCPTTVNTKPCTSRPILAYTRPD